MNVHFISKTALFWGCPEEDISVMASHLDFKTAQYQKGDIIIREGSLITDIGMVISGSVQMEHNDIWGNKSILGMVSSGDVFAEAYACVPGEAMMIDVVANEEFGDSVYQCSKTLHAMHFLQKPKSGDSKSGKD